MHSPQRQGSTGGSGDNLHRQSRRSSANSVQSNPLEQIYELETCTDPNCEENIAYNERQRLQREQENNFNSSIQNNENSNNVNEARKNAMDSSEYLHSTNMTLRVTEENLLNDYTGDCQRCEMEEYENGACGGNNEGRNGNAGNSCNGNNDFCDPLMNHNNYYDNGEVEITVFKNVIN